ncbi:hypothetical protein SAMN03097694_2323 [Janthinobacterium lividum]|uniref:Transposase n=1 Tax=Janthinobacterium lividum TaxID=29581 RepID=A0AB38C796_9BURK|nr:hypothetical protein SAMN03097694_2323 [Janthinobacterium lividum]
MLVPILDTISWPKHRTRHATGSSRAERICGRIINKSIAVLYLDERASRRVRYKVSRCVHILLRIQEFREFRGMLLPMHIHVLYAGRAPFRRPNCSLRQRFSPLCQLCTGPAGGGQGRCHSTYFSDNAFGRALVWALKIVIDFFGSPEAEVPAIVVREVCHQPTPKLGTYLPKLQITKELGNVRLFLGLVCRTFAFPFRTSTRVCQSLAARATIYTISQLERSIERISELPKQKQRFVMQMLETALAQANA